MNDPVRLQMLPETIQVVIPDALIETEDVALDPTLSKIHAMLGDDYCYTSSGKTDKHILMEALEEQYRPETQDA